MLQEMVLWQRHHHCSEGKPQVQALGWLDLRSLGVYPKTKGPEATRGSRPTGEAGQSLVAEGKCWLHAWPALEAPWSGGATTAPCPLLAANCGAQPRAWGRLNFCLLPRSGGHKAMLFPDVGSQTPGPGGCFSWCEAQRATHLCREQRQVLYLWLLDPPLRPKWPHQHQATLQSENHCCSPEALEASHRQGPAVFEVAANMAKWGQASWGVGDCFCMVAPRASLHGSLALFLSSMCVLSPSSLLHLASRKNPAL